MASRKFPRQVNFWMSINDYDALQKFFLEDGRTMTTFLRTTTRKIMRTSYIENNINQIWNAGRHKKCGRSVKFLMTDNEFNDLNIRLQDAELPLSSFFRYLTKKELHRLEFNKEKNQTWDIE